VVVALALLGLLWPARPAEAVTFDYALGLHGPDYKAAKGSVLDAAGNLYVFGDFMQYVDVDPGPNVVNVSSQGDWDIFVAKYSPNGALLWSRKLGANQSEIAKAIATDGTNVYITGFFRGSFNVGNTTLTADGQDDDIFIIKLNADGSYGWARSIGGTAFDQPHGIAISQTQSGIGVLVTGWFALGSGANPFDRVVDFDPGPGAAYLTANGEGGATFILKLDGNGNFVWAQKLESSVSGGVVGDAVAVDAAGAVYVTGLARETIDFDPGPSTVSRTFDYGTFVLKLDASGSFVWVDAFDGHFTNVNTEGWAIIARAGSVYFTGGLASTIDFDPGPGTVNLSSQGRQDIFVVKLDQATGGLSWARAIGGEDEDQGFAITLDDAGDVFVAGTSFGPLDFDPGPGTFVSGTPSTYGAFVWELDANGNFVWARTAGASLFLNAVRGIGVSATHIVYAFGEFSGTTDFDPGPGTFTLTSAPTDWVKPDFFIWRLTVDGPTNTVPPTQIISKNTDLIFSAATGNQISIAAPDAGSALGVTLTAIHGKLKLNKPTGLTFVSGTGDGDVQMSFTGTPAAANAALNGLRFTPDLSYVGGAQVKITSFLTSPSGPVRSDTDTVSIKVQQLP
jgi:hypothetical protein